MADATYLPGVYRKQGGNELVVASGGTLTVESGGIVNLASGSTLTVSGVLGIASGSTLNVASGGAITVADGGHVALPLTSITSTGEAITNFGFTTLSNSTAGLYTLAAPTRAGLQKEIFCTVGTSSFPLVVITDSTATTIASTVSGLTVCARSLNFTGPGQSVRLVSYSSTAWLLMNQFGGVTHTT